MASAGIQRAATTGMWNRAQAFQTLSDYSSRERAPNPPTQAKSRRAETYISHGFRRRELVDVWARIPLITQRSFDSECSRGRAVASTLGIEIAAEILVLNPTTLTQHRLSISLSLRKRVADCKHGFRSRNIRHGQAR